MESAVATVVLGAVLIVVGLIRGLWQEFVQGVVTGISNFSAALRGYPAYGDHEAEPERQREPLVALIGAAVMLLGILVQMQG